MSLGWYLNEPLVLLLVPKLMTCLQELGDILEGGQCTQQMEADQVETEEETVVVVPPVEEEVHGVVEDTREVEAQAQRLVLMLVVMGPESFGHGHYAGVLDLHFERNPKTHVTLLHSALILKRKSNEAGAWWQTLLVLNLSILLPAFCSFETTLIS